MLQIRRYLWLCLQNFLLQSRPMCRESLVNVESAAQRTAAAKLSVHVSANTKAQCYSLIE